jgi:hypothetical protein
MKSFNKKVLIVSLFLLIACFLPLVKKYNVENFDSKIDYLVDSTFKPECCPSVYTSSIGCLCNKNNEFEVITTRGGNRTRDDCFA